MILDHRRAIADLAQVNVTLIDRVLWLERELARRDRLVRAACAFSHEKAAADGLRDLDDAVDVYEGSGAS